MFSCLFHRFLTVLQIIRPSFFIKKNKGTFKSHSLTCFNLSLSLSLSHCFSLSFSHTQTYKHKHLHICIVCLLSVLFVFICETCLTTQGSLMIPVRSGAIWLLKLVMLFSVRPRWDKFWLTHVYENHYWYCILFVCIFVVVFVEVWCSSHVLWIALVW